MRLAEAIPLFVFTTCGLKARLEGTRVAPELIPLPLRLMTCGLFGALSVKLKVPVRRPRAVGAKAITMRQELPGAMVVHPAEAVKLPVTVRLVKVKGAVPLLSSMTIWVGLVVPIC